MARYNHYFSNFTGGEISPQTLGRSNSDLYRNSAQTIDNFIVQIQGGLERRPGTKYIADGAATTATRLIPFYHSSGAEYVLEFSNNKFRIFKDGAVVGGPTEVVTTYTTAQIPDLDYDQSGDTMYIVHPDHPPRQLTRTSDTVWTLADVDFDCAPMYPLDDSTYGRTEDIGNTAITISSLSANTLGGSATLVMSGSLFSADDVGKYMRIKNFSVDPDAEANATIAVTQTTEDVKTLDGATATVTFDGEVYTQDVQTFDGSTGAVNGRATLDLWGSLPAASYLSVPDQYVKLPKVTTTTRTTPYSTIVSTVTRTYTGATSGTAITSGTNDFDVTALHAGAGGATTDPAKDISIPYVGVTTQYSGSVITSESTTVTGNETESWGLVEITGYTNATTVTVEIIRPLSSTDFHSSQQWQMSRFGDNTGYPSKVAFHEGRCFFANIGDDTNVLVASKSNSIIDFENGEGDEGTLTAGSALEYKLSEVRAIQWINPSQRLIVGATNGVYSISGTSQQGLNPLVPPLFRKIANSSCSSVKPIFMQGVTFYTHSNSKRVAGIVFKQGEYSGFDYVDMTRFSEHLISDGIKEWAQKGDVIWVVTVNGNLRGFTFNEELNVRAWHKHTLGNGTAKSVMNLNDDQLYFAIEREIDSATVQYIENMSDSIQGITDKEDIICVDSALTYDSTATTTITGLGHLEAETLDVLADGAAHPQVTVSSGQITLTSEASVVQLGIPYTAELQTTEVVGGNRRGSSEARVTRMHEVGVKLYKTNGAIVKSTDSADTDLLFNEGQVYGSGPDLFTGTKLQRINSGNVLNPTVTVKSDRALPISILGVSADVNVQET